jgi:hypothetical protein
VTRLDSLQLARQPCVWLGYTSEIAKWYGIAGLYLIADVIAIRGLRLVGNDDHPVCWVIWVPDWMGKF